MRYILYKYPSFHGTPRQFRLKFIMKLYGWYYSNIGYTMEYLDTKTNKYYAYWM